MIKIVIGVLLFLALLCFLFTKVPPYPSFIEALPQVIMVLVGIIVMGGIFTLIQIGIYEVQDK